MPDIKLEKHPAMRVATGKIGDENQPIILVENFLKDTEAFVSAASQIRFYESDDYYPGIRTPSPESYMLLMRDVLGAIICKTFDLNPENISHSRSFLSIVSTPPDKLKPIQCIPHFDGTNPEDIAFLHYLCDEKYGGTSFYRHKGTGFEYVDQNRFETYVRTVNQETKSTGVDAQYMSASNNLFTRIDSIEPRFNRLIIYRGTSLHSGDIGEDYNFDTNPLTGRLTVTSFLYSVRQTDRAI